MFKMVLSDASVHRMGKRKQSQRKSDKKKAKSGKDEMSDVASSSQANATTRLTGRIMVNGGSRRDMDSPVQSSNGGDTKYALCSHMVCFPPRGNTVFFGGKRGYPWNLGLVFWDDMLI